MDHNCVQVLNIKVFFKDSDQLKTWFMLGWILGSNIPTISISSKMDCNGAFGQGKIAIHK
jgi:hypothetical protein